MKWYFAIPFSLLLLILCAWLNRENIIGFDPTLIIVPGTALWAAMESRQIELTKYKSGISFGPVALFIAVCLLWLAVFPWYLHVRYKIRNGLATLNEEASEQKTPRQAKGGVLGAVIVPVSYVGLAILQSLVPYGSAEYNVVHGMVSGIVVPVLIGSAFQYCTVVTARNDIAPNLAMERQEKRGTRSSESGEGTLRFFSSPSQASGGYRIPRAEASTALLIPGRR